MKAFLLAAGKGTRLRPYTDATAKCLIPIGGKALLKIWIELLERHGVGQVLINTHHHADQVERAIAEIRQRTSVEIQTVYEPELLGSAGTVFANKKFVENEKDFVIAYADNLTNLDLGRMIRHHREVFSSGGVLTMGLMRAADPSSCGIAVLDSDMRVVRFVEKPRNPESNLANAGIYIAGQRIFDFFPKWGHTETKGILDFGYDILPRLSGRIFGYEIREYLKDIGTVSAYRQALEEWPLRTK